MTNEELRALVDAATPGPWTVVGGAETDMHEVWSPTPHEPICFGHDYDDYGGMATPDAAFIAAARTEVPRLLDENAAAAGEINVDRLATAIWNTTSKIGVSEQAKRIAAEYARLSREAADAIDGVFRVEQAKEEAR